MRIFFLFLVGFCFHGYGQTGSNNLFSKAEMAEPLKVKELDLSRKHLSKLPTELLKFQNLEEIDLSENPKLDLADAFHLLAKFKNLKSLYLDYCSGPIPGNISKITNLEFLSFDGTGLTSFPEGVKKLPKLKRLDLWRNKISEINFQSGDLPNLEVMKFAMNEFTVFPKDIALLPNLRILSFYENKISYIPPEIKNLGHLKELDLRGNKLERLPEEISEMRSLKKLDLIGNQLTSISPILRLKALEWLGLGDNQIMEIPAEISELQKLDHLSLSSNPIKKIPVGIASLKSLTYISIDINDSTQLPAYLSLVAKISKLKSLAIFIRGVEVMPWEFEKLTQVEYFYFGDCDLKREERKRLRTIFPQAKFYFYKSWGDRSFYRNKPCSMNENEWDTISFGSLELKYLLIHQWYRGTDDDGIHSWNGDILLKLDKKTIDTSTIQNILIAIANRLEVVDITAARTCKAYEIMMSSTPTEDEKVKNYYCENFIGRYSRRFGFKLYSCN